MYRCYHRHAGHHQSRRKIQTSAQPHQSCTSGEVDGHQADSQLEVTQITLRPLVHFQSCWGAYDMTYLENKYSVHFLFCSATCCTINILTASLLFARHVPKLCFPPCWIMLLWILFPIFFLQTATTCFLGHIFSCHYNSQISQSAEVQPLYDTLQS